MACLLLGSVVAAAWHPGTAAAAAPVVTIKPPVSAGSYTNGQTVAVSVAANDVFTPHTRIVIIECADPGGTAAHLPTSLSTCDENTVQADTVLVKADGSFSEQNYTLYALPNATLGEQANWQPVCNQTNQCVLFLGEDQDDFTKPKVFSQPFTFTSTAATLAGGTATTTPTTPTTPSASVSAAVSLPPGTLAFTGAPDGVPWMAALGLGLVGSGLLGRRLARRQWR